MNHVSRSSTSCKLETLYSLNNHSPSCQLPATSSYHFTLSMNLTSLGTSYKWNIQYWFLCVCDCPILHRITSLNAKVLVAQLCPTFCNPMDCSPPASSVHQILQARILECISFSRGSSQPKDWTQVSCTAGRLFTIWVISLRFIYVIACDRISSLFKTIIFHCMYIPHLFTCLFTSRHLSWF